MPQTAIPFLFFRGGTSRGPYFNRSDLPEDLTQLSDLLITVLGSGHPLNIDGIGGGNPVTTKVAMLSESDDSWAEVDYFFAQISVEDRLVDYKSTCGNILSGVGPASIEMGLIQTIEEQTEIRIRSVNTGARIISTVQTPGGKVEYQGNTAIDGVPGSAAKIDLKFMDIVGSVTGQFLPTGNLIDLVDGIPVTCMDVTMPMVIAKASDFSLTGYESQNELDLNKKIFTCMESIRIKAGLLMGMGDVSRSFTPKFGILAPPKAGGTISARYFMPWSTHPTMAVTGSQCLASCTLTPGTVADGLTNRPDGNPSIVKLEHPSGTIDILVDAEWIGGRFVLRSTSLSRTARLLARGEVFVPI